MKYITSELDDLTVIYPTDCGNAPKKVVLKDFHIAAHQNDEAFVLNNLTEDSTWEVVGRIKAIGGEEIVGLLQQLYPSSTKILRITHIITHGKTTAIHGDVTLNNGDSYAFCHVHIFNNASKTAKIKETTSYIIQTKSI